MNNIIRAVFQTGDDTTKAYGLYQWNYGQKLEIHGLDLPRAVEVHFAAVDDTTAPVRIGTTVDKVTTVPIPDVLFEQEMDIKAYVYLSDAESGETIKTINMPMIPRQKPEGWHGSEETTMGAIMEAINQFADGKADGLDYKDNILKLLSGETELTRVTIAGGTGGTAKEIELQKSETAIQWRHTGEEEWRDLVLLEELRGEPGTGGKTAYQYAQDGGYAGTEGEFAQKLATEYLTEETDPTVSAWAKKPTKPNYTADEVGADTSGTAENKVSTHNTATDAHSDIRLLVQGLTNKLNALADSDDTTLDQMSEVVAYIKSNKSLIDAITTSKVNVSDIIDNLTTNVANKPLSAAQGVALKSLIDNLEIIAGDADKKLDKPETAPEVGKILQVIAVNDDGTFTCAWADAPIGGVTDVQISGESIVSDGVAAIPFAGEAAFKKGLFSYHPNYGLELCSTNKLVFGLTNWNPEWWEKKRSGQFSESYTEDRRAVTNCNVDYAVKLVMCDGKGVSWTDVERIAALLRMGCTVDDNGFVKWTAQEVTE